MTPEQKLRQAHEALEKVRALLEDVELLLFAAKDLPNTECYLLSKSRDFTRQALSGVRAVLWHTDGRQLPVKQTPPF